MYINNYIYTHIYICWDLGRWDSGLRDPNTTSVLHSLRLSLSISSPAQASNGLAQ